MRKILPEAGLGFLCLLLSVSKAQSQTPDTSTYEGKLSYVFTPLNKNFITTNYLEERGAAIMPLQDFEGVLHDSNLVDVNTWRMAYFSFYTGFVGSSNVLIDVVTLKNQIKSSWNDTTAIPVPVFYGQYNTVKADAFTNNQLYISNEQVFDVPGRTGTPYHTRELYLAAPVKTFSKKGDVSFIFYSNQYYTNTTKQVSNFFVDFADGAGYQTVGFNTPVSIAYTTAGSKRLKIKTVFTDNSSKECYSDFTVMNPSNTNHTYTNEPDFQQRFGVFPAGANVSVRFSRRGTERSITKPLIVVEGYDIGFVAPNISENFNYRNLLDLIGEPFPIYDFNQQLDDIAGYDLIFVDFDNGAADIVANAAIVEQIITWVNQQKAINGSTEQNVVMGFSMGGLISRYALAEMTKTGNQTGTRLLITHDSPHRGANVPLGLQQFILMSGEVTVFGFTVRDLIPQYDEAINLLNQPATQQMLILRANSPTTSVTNNFLDFVYRNMVTFSPTDPQPTYRFIGTSMGSECANQLFAPYSPLVTANANVFLLIPIPRTRVFITYRFKTEAQVRALPGQGTSQNISHLYVKSQFKLWGIINLFKDIYNNNSYSPSTSLPWDGLAGGTVGAGPEEFPAPLDFQINFFPFVKANYRIVNEICFVPRESALDITNLNTSAFTTPYVSGINPGNHSRTNTFIAQDGFVTQHDSINSIQHLHHEMPNGCLMRWRALPIIH